jgi:hypothetical protein
LGLKWRSKQQAEGKCITRSVMICTPHKMYYRIEVTELDGAHIICEEKRDAYRGSVYKLTKGDHL